MTEAQEARMPYDNQFDWKCWRDPKHTINPTMFGWPVCFDCGAGPDYHERRQYVRKDFALALYILPPGPLNAIIAPRSAIVGLHDGGTGPDDRTEIYFEGWTHGPMQYGDRDARGLWEAGVGIAADRMITRYPTVACASPLSKTLTTIGLFFPVTNRIVVDDEAALTTWLEA